MFCKNCGTEMDDNTTFCPKCGAAQSAPETQTPPPADRVTQQVPPQQPQTAGLAPATEAEKNAYFKSAGSVLMLVVTIIATVSLIIGFVSNVLTLNIFGIIGMVLTILITVGMWIAWANAKNKKMNATGIKLIRIPYIIQFVFAVIGFALTFLGYVLLMIGSGALGSLVGGEDVAALGIGVLVFMLMQQLIPFILECIIFASLNKTLKVAQAINSNTSVAGQSASKALGIILIITAALDVILAIVGLVLNPLFGIFTLISTIFSAAYMIVGAIILLGFAKNLNAAHGQL